MLFVFRKRRIAKIIIRDISVIRVRKKLVYYEQATQIRLFRHKIQRQRQIKVDHNCRHPSRDNPSCSRNQQMPSVL